MKAALKNMFGRRKRLMTLTALLCVITMITSGCGFFKGPDAVSVNTKETEIEILSESSMEQSSKVNASTEMGTSGETSTLDKAGASSETSTSSEASTSDEANASGEISASGEASASGGADASGGKGTSSGKGTSNGNGTSSGTSTPTVTSTLNGTVTSVVDESSEAVDSDDSDDYDNTDDSEDSGEIMASSESTEPSESTDPSEPMDSSESTDPGESTVPSESTDSGESTESADSDDPEEPDTGEGDNKESEVNTVFDQSTVDVSRPTAPEGSTGLRVMSFNIQESLPTDDSGALTDGAKNRIEAVKDEILLYSPDLLGMQEDVVAWHSNLALDGYKVIQDTSSTSGERCAIYYKSGLKLITSKTVWMSSNGTKNGVALTVADLFEEGGKYQMSQEHLAMLGITKDSPDTIFKASQTTYVDENGITQTTAKYAYLGTRIMNYGVFEINGRYVIYVNTHLQNRSQNAIYSNEALQKLRNLERVKHFDMLQATVDELKETYKDAVVFVTGDFNDLPESEVYNNACNNHGYSCASVTAQEKAENGGTWNNAFNVKVQGDSYPHEADGTTGDTLDYCFVDQNITVQKFSVGAGKATITAVDGSEKTIYTSDHLPIVTDICFATETTGSPIAPEEPNAPSVYSGKPDTSWYNVDDVKSEYVLTTADQLMGIQELRSSSAGAINFKGITIKLGCDMVINEGTPEEIALRGTGTYAWRRTNSAHLFEGTFDGQGHTISGLYMKLTTNGSGAMFGGVGGNAVITNFTLENTYFGGPTKDTTNLGIIAAKVSGEGADVTISDVTVNGIMVEDTKKLDYVGGLIARVDNSANGKLTVTNCKFNGTINFSQGNYIGGILGYVNNANVEIVLKDCAVKADITAADFCGGIVGYAGSTKSISTEGCTYEGTLTGGSNKGTLIGNVQAE